MTVIVRRLGPGDEGALTLLAREDADFDIAGRGGGLEPLRADDAQSYLSDPRLLHWVAEDIGIVVGFMYCHHLRKRVGEGSELLLYEIGVHKTRRRQAIGKSLLETMRAWMEVHRVRECWVLADNLDAVEFYRACGFCIPSPPPVYMTWELHS